MSVQIEMVRLKDISSTVFYDMSSRNETVQPLTSIDTKHSYISNILWQSSNSSDSILVTYQYIADIDIFIIGQPSIHLKTLKTFIDNREGNLSILNIDSHRILVGSSKGVIRMWSTSKSANSKPQWEIQADPSTSRHECGGVIHISLIDAMTFVALTRSGMISFFDFRPANLTVKSFGSTPSPLLVHRHRIDIESNFISGVTPLQESHLLLLSISNQNSFICNIFSGNVSTFASHY